MGDWLENFVMCEELICEIVNELRQDQEQVPPVAASEVLTPEIETPESGPPSAYVLEEKKKNGLVFKKIENEIVRGGVKFVEVLKGAGGG